VIEIDIRLPLAPFTLAVCCGLSANVTALVGPSGSGKTSLIESIAGLRRVKGRIVIDGTTLLDSDRGIDLPPERRSIGYVPQDAALFPHLRVAENIRFGGNDEQRFEALVSALELAPLLERVPTSLSGGERQRVALARALMTQPRLLLLDEPLASIDQPLRERILLYLRRVRDLGIPMIYVTHQPFEALALSSWCVVLRDGRVAAEGASRQSGSGGERGERLRSLAAATRSRPRHHARDHQRRSGARPFLRSGGRGEIPAGGENQCG
jgi:molybdate transport system ATP-binding protein